MSFSHGNLIRREYWRANPAVRRFVLLTGISLPGIEIRRALRDYVPYYYSYMSTVDVNNEETLVVFR